MPYEAVISRPGGEGDLTPVDVGLYVIDLLDVDDVEQTFTADLHLAVSWSDPRLAEGALGRSLAGCRLGLDEVWNPHVAILNERSLDDALEDTVEVDANGRVLYRQRKFGKLSAGLDLHDFPFDRQVLPVRLTSLRFNDREMMLGVDEFRTGIRDDLAIAGWRVSMGESRSGSELLVASGRSLVRLDFRIDAQRESTFYVLKALLPLGLIVFMAWTVFWIDPSQVGPQIGVPTSAVLTLIAFQFRLGQILPKVSYLTRADKLVLGASLLVFLALGEAVLTTRLTFLGRSELALAIDRWARYVYLVLFLVLVLFTVS